MTPREIVFMALEHLRKKLGDDEPDYAPHKEMWCEHEWNGSTESGFYSTYSINWAEVEEEMDRWIEERFGGQR